MPAYYNEINEFAADWLRQLIADGEIPSGDVDTRSIVEVRPEDLDGYEQVHLFAGVGGWPLALRLIGWPDDWRIWSGSAPCQPWSSAGRRQAFADERHLWPHYHRLVRHRRPPLVVGEQVASPDALSWFDRVRADLDAIDYACRVEDRPACCEGPRVDVEAVAGLEELAEAVAGLVESAADGQSALDAALARFADASPTADRYWLVEAAPHIRQRLWWLAHPAGQGLPLGYARAGDEPRPQQRPERLRSPRDLFVGDADSAQLEVDQEPPAWQERKAAPGAGWSDYGIVWCEDGVFRRTQSGVSPLADRLPRSVGPGGTREQRMALVAAKANRKGRLVGYGNAINPVVAAGFLRQAFGMMQ